jgi:hypothetical protein
MVAPASTASSSVTGIAPGARGSTRQAMTAAATASTTARPSAWVFTPSGSTASTTQSSSSTPRNAATGSARLPVAEVAMPIS